MTTKIIKDNSIPVHLYIHKLAFSLPNNFLPQALHDKDSRMKITLCALAIVGLLTTLPTMEIGREVKIK